MGKAVKHGVSDVSEMADQEEVMDEEEVSEASVSSPVDDSDSYCQLSCGNVADCARSKYSSYCKSTRDGAVCFGLYVRQQGGLCFAPNDPTCDDKVLLPLTCPSNDD